MKQTIKSYNPKRECCIYGVCGNQKVVNSCRKIVLYGLKILKINNKNT